MITPEKGNNDKKLSTAAEEKKKKYLWRIKIFCIKITSETAGISVGNVSNICKAMHKWSKHVCTFPYISKHISLVSKNDVKKNIYIYAYSHRQKNIFLSLVCFDLLTFLGTRSISLYFELEVETVLRFSNIPQESI